MEVNVDPSDLVTRKADSKGRVTIGAEYADEEVTVAVVERENETNEYPQPDRCAECGDAIQEFAIVEGNAVCLDCAGLAENHE